MKKYYQSIILLLLLPFSSVSFAEQQPAGQSAPGMAGHASMGMMGMMEKMTPEEREQHLRAEQEHILKMHDLSNQILAEKDPAKKEQLKNQQLQLMKEHRAKMMAVHHPMMK